VIVCLPVLLVLGLRYDREWLDDHMPEIVAAATGFQLVVQIAIALTALRLVAGPDWRRAIAVRLPSVTHTVLVVVSFLPMMLLANGAYELIKLVIPDVFEMVGQTDPMEYMLELTKSWPLSLAVLLIGVGPAIAEELWCRGFLGRGLVGNYGVVAGIVLTSLLFGAIHLVPRQGAAAVLIGLWLHFSYVATRSLLVPMLLHFLNNSFAVILASLGSRVKGLEALDQPGILLYLNAGMLLAVVGWTLHRCRAHLVPPLEPDHWNPAYPGVEMPPSWSLTTIAHPWPNWLEIVLIVLTFGGLVAQIAVLMVGAGL
jgi:membrane protease YdiL (CAAX protease family)